MTAIITPGEHVRQLRAPGDVGHAEHFGEPVHHHVAALELRDDVSADEILGAWPLARATARPDRHDDPGSQWLIGRQAGISGNVRTDIARDQLWQMDIVGGVFLADGTEAKIVTGLDDHSRYCVIASVVPRATGRAVCLTFAGALRRYGVPGEVLTDIQAVH
jgi:hypothetical protein